MGVRIYKETSIFSWIKKREGLHASLRFRERWRGSYVPIEDASDPLVTYSLTCTALSDSGGNTIKTLGNFKMLSGLL